MAANRFNPALGFRFSTHANDWVDKYIRLYCEELVSVVPRNDPERRVMDLIAAPNSPVKRALDSEVMSRIITPRPHYLVLLQLKGRRPKYLSGSHLRPPGVGKIEVGGDCS